MRLSTTQVVVGMAVFVVLAAVIPEIFREPTYPSWSGQNPIEVTRTLAQNKIRGCGEYRVKSDGRSRHKFLVRCTRDGENWTNYKVDTSNNRVTRP